MPSFWNWLCFPQKRLSKQQSQKLHNHGNSKYKSKGEYVHLNSMQKRKLIDLNNDQTRHDMDNSMYQSALRNTNQEKYNSGQRLLDESRSNKRRRVQDIFTQETDEKVVHVRNNHFCDNQNSNHLVFSSQSPYSNKQKKGHFEFGSGYTPGMYKLKNGQRHQPVESMYGYTPKIVQNVYASTALEGKKIDDFFGSLHEESSMCRFANIDNKQTYLEASLSSKLSHHPVSSKASIDNGDKLSLIEHDVNGNQTVVEWDENFQHPILQTPLTQHMAELDFEKIWGSGDDGEVLY